MLSFSIHYRRIVNLGGDKAAIVKYGQKDREDLGCWASDDWNETDNNDRRPSTNTSERLHQALA